MYKYSMYDVVAESSGFCCREESANYGKSEVNSNVKDTLFRKLFGNSPSDLLDLYNALNNSSYTNVDDLEINTIDDAIYMKIKNDVSFIVDSHMVLIEHQSTINPNMPLRGLFYFASLYQKYISGEKRYRIYGPGLVKIPAPRFVVLYNGKNNMKTEKQILRLSDAFSPQEKDSGFEWTATVFNINYGHNKEILLKCKKLDEYCKLVDKIREYNMQSSKLKDAINKAVDYCIRNNILKEFLLAHKAEVGEMILTEYNEEEHMAALKEYYEEQITQEKNRANIAENKANDAENRANIAENKQINMLKNMLAKGKTKTEILDLTGITDKEYVRLLGL